MDFAAKSREVALSSCGKARFPIFGNAVYQPLKSASRLFKKPANNRPVLMAKGKLALLCAVLAIG
jgi:hypothetical protein